MKTAHPRLGQWFSPVPTARRPLDGSYVALAKKDPKSDPARQPSFEQALDKLEGIVHRLEQGEIGLNEALARYGQGVKLLRRCYELLEKAERRIELLSGVDAEGNPITTPLDDSSPSLGEKARHRSRRRSAALPEESAKPDEVDDEDTDIDRSGKLF